MSTEERAKQNQKLVSTVRACKLIHFILMIGLFFACWFLFYQRFAEMSINVKRFNFIVCLAYFTGMMILTRIYRAYAVGIKKNIELFISQAVAIIVCDIIAYLVYCVAWWFVANPLPLLACLIIQLGLTNAWCKIANSTFNKLSVPHKTIILYRNKQDLKRVEEMYKYSHQFDVCEEKEIVGETYEQLYCIMDPYEVVVIAGIEATTRNAIAKYCIEKNKSGYFIPHVGDLILEGGTHAQQFSTPVINIHRANLRPEYAVIKRLEDIVFSGLAIIILSPIMLITAIAIKCYDHGPVLYKQTRLTIGGKEFQILKFRSMKEDAESDGVARLATEDDDRITPIGRFIRKCRIDELPQLFNIFVGDMTIVGPRPERPEIAKQYEEAIPAFNLRLQVKAGLTGYAQIYGRYNTDPYDKLQLDLIYINKMDALLDLELMFATAGILFIKDSTSGIANGTMVALNNEADKRNEN